MCTEPAIDILPLGQNRSADSVTLGTVAPDAGRNGNIAYHVHTFQAHDDFLSPSTSSVSGGISTVLTGPLK